MRTNRNKEVNKKEKQKEIVNNTKYVALYNGVMQRSVGSGRDRFHEKKLCGIATATSNKLISDEIRRKFNVGKSIKEVVERRWPDVI